jgi:hypothetical protein
MNRRRIKPLVIVGSLQTGTEPNLWWLYGLYKEVENQTFGDCTSFINRCRTKPLVLVLRLFIKLIHSPKVWFCSCWLSSYKNQMFPSAPVYKSHTITKGLVLHLFIKLIQSPKVWFCTCLSSLYNHQRFALVLVYKTHTITKGLVLHLFIKLMQSLKDWFCTCL